jgi:hypothetical protein
MKALVLNALGRGFDPWHPDGLDAGYFVKPTVRVAWLLKYGPGAW